MSSITLRTQPIHRRWLMGVAWATMLLLSRLPQILFQQVLGLETSFAWTSLGTALLLLAISAGGRLLQPLRGYLAVMATVMLFTGPVDGILRNSGLWVWAFGADRGWTLTFLGERLPLLLEAVLVALVLSAAGIKRQEFFLSMGNVHAPVTGLRRSGLRSRWLLAGPLLTFLVGGLAVLGTALMNGIGFAELSSVLPLAPFILLAAAINGFGEELVYRAAPLSQLRGVVGESHAIWLTAIWFGLGHYDAGGLGGAGYAVAAGVLALLFGKAMVETRGILMPTFMHMVIDAVLFTFIALGARQA